MSDKKMELKLTPINTQSSLKSPPDLTDLTNGLWTKWLKDNTTPYFGSILPIFESKAFKYKIVEFYPHAVEIDKRKKAFYQTVGEAIDACFTFLKKQGYNAEIIDLESYLSRV